jgi:thymidylate synthase
MIPDTILVEERKSLSNAWYRILRLCLTEGVHIPASTTTPPIVMTKDINGIVVLTGDAIQSVLNDELHPGFPTKQLLLEEYKKTFSKEFGRKQHNLPDDSDGKFVYTYIERLLYRREVSFDQLASMARILRRIKINRRIQIVTWDAPTDIDSPEPPCLQRIWIRQLSLEPDADGLYPIELHIFWRSRDLYAAWMSNVIAVVNMIVQYVCMGEYKIVKIVDDSDSLHIYEADWDAAAKVKPSIVMA